MWPDTGTRHQVWPDTRYPADIRLFSLNIVNSFWREKIHLTLFINSYIVLCNKNLKTTANYRFKIYRSFLRRIIRLAISGIRTETGYQTRSDIPSWGDWLIDAGDNLQGGRGGPAWCRRPGSGSWSCRPRPTDSWTARCPPPSHQTCVWTRLQSSTQIENLSPLYA